MSEYNTTHTAVEMDDIDALREALAAGADVENVDSSNLTLLQHAIDTETQAWYGGYDLHVDLTALLLSFGADPVHVLGPVGQSALQMAEETSHWMAVTLFKAWTAPSPRQPARERRSVLKRLLNIFGDGYGLLLHEAVRRNDIDLLRGYLAEYPDHVEAVNGNRTLLQYAIEVEAEKFRTGHGWHIDMTAMILAVGADPEKVVKDIPRSALQVAQDSGHWLAVLLFNAYCQKRSDNRCE